MTRISKINIFGGIFARLLLLAKLPAFWVVTFVGNSFVLVGAFLLYHLEHDIHQRTIKFIDCLSWAVGLVTTIGYGDLIPISTEGKVLGIIMMIGGTVFLWSYMALVVGALLAPDISQIEREIKFIKKESDIDDKKIDDLMQKIDALSKTIESIQPNRQKNI